MLPRMLPDTWHIEQPAFNPATFKAFEGLFTLGSPGLHVRGSLEQPIPGQAQDAVYDRRAANVTSEQFRERVTKLGTYIPGVYCQHPTLNMQLVNLPSPLGLGVRCEGRSLEPGCDSIAEDVRTLDLHRAVLTRRVHWRLHAGLSLELTFDRFVSRARPGLLVQRLRIESTAPTEVDVDATIDARVTTNGYDHFRSIEWSEPTVMHRASAPGEDVLGHASTLAARVVLDSERAVHVQTLVRSAATHVQHAVEGRLGAVTSRLHVLPHVSAHIEKISALSPDVATALPVDVRFDDLLAEHEHAWRAAWTTSDVEIDGDLQAQRAARVAIFHLLRAHPQTDALAIDAKGYAGEAYWGRFFWDTEMYLLPFFLYTQPERARELVGFRVRTLEGARANAKAKGQQGARYAWESDARGIECCPNWQYADHEVHVSADVVFGFDHYARGADDAPFNEQDARDATLDVARYWLDRVDRRPNDDRWHLLGVMGPDEYTPISSNNAFTNRMVSRAIERAADLLASAPSDGLGREHVLHVAQSLPIPAAGDLVLQCEEWPLLAEPRFDERWADRSRTFAAQVPQEVLYRSRCLKQADVLMLMAMLPHEFSDAQVRAAWSEYLPYTTHDSSLSPGAHCLVALRLGMRDDAWRFWQMGSGQDLDVEHGGAAEGIHIAGAGAIWQMIVFGFAGMKTAIESDTLSFAPRLPVGWNRLRFPICWRKSAVAVDLTRSTAHVEHRSGPSITVDVRGHRRTITPGQSATWDLA